MTSASVAAGLTQHNDVRTTLLRLPIGGWNVWNADSYCRLPPDRRLQDAGASASSRRDVLSPQSVTYLPLCHRIACMPVWDRDVIIDCGSVAILCIAQCRTFWLGLHMLGKVSWLTAGKDRLQYTRSLPTNSLMCDSYWNSQITLSHFCNFFLPVAFESGHDILFRITWIRLLVQLHCVVFNRMVPVRLRRWRLLKALSPQRQKQQLSIHRYLTIGIVWSYRVLFQCIRTSASLTASVSVRGLHSCQVVFCLSEGLLERSLVNFIEMVWWYGWVSVVRCWWWNGSICRSGNI